MGHHFYRAQCLGALASLPATRLAREHAGKDASAPRRFMQ